MFSSSYRSLWFKSLKANLFAINSESCLKYVGQLQIALAPFNSSGISFHRNAFILHIWPSTLYSPRIPEAAPGLRWLGRQTCQKSDLLQRWLVLGKIHFNCFMLQTLYRCFKSEDNRNQEPTQAGCFKMVAVSFERKVLKQSLWTCFHIVTFVAYHRELTFLAFCIHWSSVQTYECVCMNPQIKFSNSMMLRMVIVGT